MGDKTMGGNNGAGKFEDVDATALADRQGEYGIRYVLAACVNLSTSMLSARSCARQRS